LFENIRGMITGSFTDLRSILWVSLEVSVGSPLSQLKEKR